MDPLCRLGFLAVEMLLQAENSQEDTADEERSVILFNHSSSIVADKAYQKTINSTREYFPSPSAFVYTLPNIVTGEIAIRHGYHNETSFYMLKEKNEETMSKIVRATLADTPTTSAISGWLDYADESHFEADITLFVKQ
jgi:3-oxoacyl-[acyl-carrier-protein] synthase-1